MAKPKNGAGKTGRGGKKLNAREAMIDAAAAANKTAADSNLLMPPTKKVQDLAKDKRNTKQRVGEISGVHADAVRDASDKKHLDKKAFAIACSLDALTDEKLQVTYFHLLRYMDDLKIPDRASAQGQIFGNDEQEKEDDDPTPGQEQGHGLRIVPGEGRLVAQVAGER